MARPGAVAPLDDPAYAPQHPPANGGIPAVIEKWGPRSQLRWFRRFRQQLRPQFDEVWGRYYCQSEHHRGLCCPSCEDEAYDGYGVQLDGYCCCRQAGEAH